MHFADDVPLGQARAWLRKQVADGGAHCPCCTQFAKIYQRKLHATMARALITLYRHTPQPDPVTDGFIHAPSLPGDTHEISQCVWWKLIEEEADVRADGGRTGWWRITDTGLAFVQNRLAIPKYAHVYDGRCLGLHGDPQTISDCLGDRFDYTELMSG